MHPDRWSVEAWALFFRAWGVAYTGRGERSFTTPRTLRPTPQFDTFSPAVYSIFAFLEKVSTEDCVNSVGETRVHSG